MHKTIREILANMGLPTAAEASAGGAVPEPAPVVTPDCTPWCGGQGVRRIGMAPRPLGAPALTLAQMLRLVEYDYCSCQAGQAVLAEHARIIGEIEEREAQAKVERLWNAAELPTLLRGYTFESYLALPDALPPLVEKLRRWQLAERTPDGFRRWLLLFGSKGTYKTSLAASLLQDHLRSGRSGLFVAAPSFLERIRHTFRSGRDTDSAGADAYEVMAAAIAVDLLILDDVGANTLTSWVQEQFYTLISERDLWDRPTIITTNLGLADLEEHLGYRTFDRIRGNCSIEGEETFCVQLVGESRRGRSWTGARP